MATLDFATASLDYRRGALGLLSRMSADTIAVMSDMDQARLDRELGREEHAEIRRSMELARKHLDKAYDMLFANMEPTGGHPPDGADSHPDPALTMGANTEEHPVIEAA